MNLDTKKNDKHNTTLIDNASYCLLLSFTFFVFGPITLFLTNQDEFWFRLSDVILVCGIGFVICFFLLLLISIILPKRARTVYGLLLFGFALGLYIENSIISTDYGRLDGTPIDWNSYHTVALWNTVIWMACIIVPAILSNYKEVFINIIKFITLFILGVEFLSLIILWIITPQSEVKGNLTTDGQFQLSSHNNIIVFVLDAYDSAFFREFYEANPDYIENVFDGFTYYPDTVTGGSRTILGMPYILTGYAYTTETTFQEYIDEAYKQTTLYKELINRNYDIGIYTGSSYVSSDLKNSIVNYDTSRRKVASYANLAMSLYKLTAFRQSPHVLKRFFWMYSGEFEKAAYDSEQQNNKIAYTFNDSAFFSVLEESGITVNKVNGSFRLYHLTGMHAPYHLTRTGEYSSRYLSMEEQERGVLLILDTFFKEMKRNDIYDKSDIIVLADHGEIGMSQNPLLLIKRKGIDEHLETDSTPVSYVNLQPTMLSMINAPYEGISIENLTMEDNEKRFFIRESNDNYAEEYVVVGYAANVENVSFTGRKFRLFSGNTSGSTGIKYKLGTTIEFGISATALPYIVDGFSKTEADHIWIDGLSASLQFDLGQIKDDILLNMEYSVFDSPRHVIIFANDEMIADYNANMSESKDIVISQSLITDGLLNLRIEMVDPPSEDAIKKSGDNRMLGLALKTMTLSLAP